MRKSLVAVLILGTSCSPPEAADSFERWSALDSAIDPVRTVAVAAAWYEHEHERWPERLADLADLSEELGHALQEPPEPIPIPTAERFRELRFEPLGDTLLRIRFEHAPFDLPATDGMPDAPARPAVHVRESRGFLDVSGPGSGAVRRAVVDRAVVESEGSEIYTFTHETMDLQPLVFLEPIPREEYPLR